MKIKIRVALAACVAAVATTSASASHRWSTYHWQKGSGPLSVSVGDNVDSKWDSHLAEAMQGGLYTDTTKRGDGWNDATYANGAAIIASPIVVGGTNPKNCRAVAGTIQVCNSRYGGTGWLGLASIWLSGGHISQGTTKVNDTYFDTAKYDKPAWRRLVMCQEIGHDYGLSHTNEIFDNYNDGTCMDYTDAPAGGFIGAKDYGPSNEYINQHDKDMLATMYNHSETAATNFGVRTVGQAPQSSSAAEDIPGDSPAQWGRAIHFDGRGRPDVFELTLGNDRRKITHVFWTMEADGRGGH